jgi:hypothetical protein
MGDKIKKVRCVKSHNYFKGGMEFILFLRNNSQLAWGKGLLIKIGVIRGRFV